MNGWSFRSYKKRSVLKRGSPAEVQPPTKIQFNLYWQTLARLQLLFVKEKLASVLRHEKKKSSLPEKLKQTVTKM